MSTNLATIIGGPCLISYAGSSFRSKGDVTVNLALDTFGIVTDLYGEVDKRVSGQPVKISFTPEGRFADLAVLFPFLTVAIGSLITPVWPCGTVDATANTIAVANTALAAGTPISFGTSGTMPTGLTAGTLYYLGANSSGVRTVHTSAANAIAGTSPIDITGIGSGLLKFVVQQALVILGNDGTQVTFHNSAVSKMPAINFKATDTLWGDVEFSAYPKNAVPWSTANSLYTLANNVSFSDSGFAPSDIITQPYAFTWGSAPWSSLYTKNGITVEPSLTLENIEDDASGVLTQRISAIGFTAKMQPVGPDLSAFLTALTLQDSGATRGRSLAGSDLNIQGTGVYARLYAAALTGGPANWSSKNDRLGELTWAATRTFSDGAANPLFYIGDSAPA